MKEKIFKFIVLITPLLFLAGYLVIAQEIMTQKENVMDIVEIATKHVKMKKIDLELYETPMIQHKKEEKCFYIWFFGRVTKNKIPDCFYVRIRQDYEVVEMKYCKKD